MVSPLQSFDAQLTMRLTFSPFNTLLIIIIFGVTCRPAPFVNLPHSLFYEKNFDCSTVDVARMALCGWISAGDTRSAGDGDGRISDGIRSGCILGILQSGSIDQFEKFVT